MADALEKQTDEQSQTDATQAETAKRVQPQTIVDTKIHKPPTPMMAQYIEIKSANADCLLFYRMGDFYEMFFDDAIEASQALGIQLTTRGKHLGEDIPMCGVPVRAADEYLQRLIEKGFRVAVCDQTEDPSEAKKRGSKAVVRRDVTRLVTAGTLTEDNLLEPRQNNFLGSLSRIKAKADGAYALAWVDISTGDFTTTNLTPSALLSEIARLDLRELLVPDNWHDHADLLGHISELDAVMAFQPASYFDSLSGERALKRFFAVEALEVFGDFTRAQLSACGALIKYIELTQVGNVPAIRPPANRHANQFMMIDAATRANLELTRTMKGERAGSLLSVIDRTVTGAGARALGQRLSDPSSQPDRIISALDGVEFFLENPNVKSALRAALKQSPDVKRALARLTVGRGSPRDLGGLRDGLKLARAIPPILNDDTSGNLPDRLKAACHAVAEAKLDLVDTLDDMLAESLPVHTRDGDFIRAGYRIDLDENRTLRDDSRKVIAGLQSTYTEKTGIKTLKIKHNNVLGYFIEVTAQHGDRFMSQPLNETFIHRQTLANAMRFTTTELAELESGILAAANRALSIELGLFDHALELVNAASGIIGKIADGLAELDVYAALAELAEDEKYVRPRVDASTAFEIKAGRHPVVEQALNKAGEQIFVPNDCSLSAEEDLEDAGADTARLWLLTGPNMAGKSTFLRQNALIAILAQIGSYVPADSAYIGAIDKIFSRVGAADDLARGRSTFMVEMVETATILNQATSKSLVILDEIGRGTATFDGLSIAWACVEHLHNTNRCRTLFATHFHELTALSGELTALSNVTMRVKEHKDDVIFLHEVAAGSADRSYGIQVAKLAGLPADVLHRAADVLAALERQQRQTPAVPLADDLPLFSASKPESKSSLQKEPTELESVLSGILPDELTPREALDLIYKIKSIGQND